MPRNTVTRVKTSTYSISLRESKPFFGPIFMPPLQNTNSIDMYILKLSLPGPYGHTTLPPRWPSPYSFSLLYKLMVTSKTKLFL